MLDKDNLKFHLFECLFLTFNHCDPLFQLLQKWIRLLIYSNHHIISLFFEQMCKLQHMQLRSCKLLKIKVGNKYFFLCSILLLPVSPVFLFYRL